MLVKAPTRSTLSPPSCECWAFFLSQPLEWHSPSGTAATSSTAGLPKREARMPPIANTLLVLGTALVVETICSLLSWCEPGSALDHKARNQHNRTALDACHI